MNVEVMSQKILFYCHEYFYQADRSIFSSLFSLHSTTIVSDITFSNSNMLISACSENLFFILTAINPFFWNVMACYAFLVDD